MLVAPQRAEGTVLARILFAIYAVLTIYASLHPLEGWRDVVSSPFAFLVAPWPRSTSGFDILVNVLGYAPYGFLCVAALYPGSRGAPAFAVAVSSAALLSILMESAQNYLPTRFASNVDVLSNVGGAVLGAAVAVAFTPWLLEHGPLRRLRAGAFLQGAAIDYGLALIALWLFIQLNPTTLLFGAGDLRDLVVPAVNRPRAPEFFASIEAFTAAANLVAVALLVSVLAPADRPVRAMVAALVATALVVKSSSFALTRDNAFIWVTPGAFEGLFGGMVIALAAVALPRTARLVLAAVLLMAATVLVNLAPANPYLTNTLRVWHQGHFLNFNGLTRLVSAAWPFIALGYLIFLAARRGREEAGPARR
ncbi:MAG TPA: VanZ family protein [Burkholderiales bacterium]|nr:VanZ family protein [Burkholderiales bacterium]